MLEGSVVGGKYRVDRVLAQGGMGTVLAATHLQLEQRVAIKTLLPELMEDPLAVERFLREGKAVARLHSEHICRVLDVDLLEDGVPYMVMELLDGSDLERVIRDCGPLHEHVAAAYVLQACIGLAEAHARGIVHRDLKPANLFLSHGVDDEPLVKVLDFGIAKITASAQNLTSTMSVIGTPHYMSPEQLRASRNVDARSDIWALGTILYELASGTKAFPAESLMELSLRIAMDPPAPLPLATPAFRDVVFRCLTKEPAERFADLVELSDALAVAVPAPELRELATAVARVYYSGKPEELSRQLHKVSLSEIGVPALEPPTVSLSRRRWFGAALGSGLAIAAAAALLFGLPKSSESEPTASAPAASLPAPAATGTLPAPAAHLPPAADEPPLVVPFANVEPAQASEPVATPAELATAPAVASDADADPAPTRGKRRDKHRRRERDERGDAAGPAATSSTFAASAAVTVPAAGPPIPPVPPPAAPPPPPPSREPEKPNLQLVDPFER